VSVYHAAVDLGGGGLLANPDGQLLTGINEEHILENKTYVDVEHQEFESGSSVLSARAGQIANRHFMLFAADALLPVIWKVNCGAITTEALKCPGSRRCTFCMHRGLTKDRAKDNRGLDLRQRKIPMNQSINNEGNIITAYVGVKYLKNYE
jgi:hypothetical protein